MAQAKMATWKYVLYAALVLALCVTTGAIVACGGDDAATDTASSGERQEVVIAGFGGALGEAEKAAYFDPFVTVDGGKVKILQVEASLAAVRQQVESGKVLWDIVELGGPDMIAGGQDGTLMKMDTELIDTTQTWDYEGVSGVMDYGVDSNHYTEGIGYLTTEYETPPTWEDFFNLEKYPGRRAMEKYIQDGTLEYSLLGQGVPKEELYPLDIDKAIAGLESLGDEVVFVDSLAQASQLLISGDVKMTQTAAGRMLALQKGGLEVGYNPVGQTGGSYFCIPTGAPHAEEAMKFLAFITSYPEGSTMMADLTGYAGPNKAGNDAAQGMGSALIFTNPEVQALGFPVSLDWWTPENTEKATEAFNAFLAGQ